MGLSQILAVMVASMYEAFLPMNKLGACAYRQMDNTSQNPANPAEVKMWQSDAGTVADKTYGGSPSFSSESDGSKTYPMKLVEKINKFPWNDSHLLQIIQEPTVFNQRMMSFVRNMWSQVEHDVFDYCFTQAAAAGRIRFVGTSGIAGGNTQLAKDLAFQTNVVEGGMVDLDDRNVPDGERILLLSPKDRGQVRGATRMAEADKTGDPMAVQTWDIAVDNFGIMYKGSNNLPKYGTEAIAGTVLVDGAVTAGAKTVTIDGTGYANVKVGHIISLGGAGKYIVVAVSEGTNENTLTLHTGVAADVANNAAVAAIASTTNWRPSMLFDRASFGYVPRIFASAATIMTAGFVDFQQDPESGLELFLEAKRGNNMTQFDVSSGLYAGIIPDAFQILVPA